MEGLFDVFDAPSKRKVDDVEESKPKVQKKSEGAGPAASGEVVKKSKKKKSSSSASASTAEASASLPVAKIEKKKKEPKIAENEFLNIRVECLANDDSKHEVCLPPGFTLEDAMRKPEGVEPARTYKFKLDPFQQRAVESIDREQSVLVSAHTSAGKTAVAEYAIAKSMKNQQRVIYTTPLKALSNQKFRDFQEEFQDVGLMTGDVTINPNASCLVMTTEILRSMLYRGSEIVREVAWVVFDEIHYMRDRERGVVWEESIILVPHKVHFVFLSATIPNASEFACWVAAVHNQPCHVVYTDYRPTPLQHYVFPAGGEGLYLVVDEKGIFREDQFYKACGSLENAPAKSGGGAKGPGGRTKPAGGAMQKGGSDIYKIVKVIMERNYDPVIIFAFSKKDCESLALQMSKLDFNTEDEKANVEKIYNSALDCLNDDDRGLPQVEHMLPLLRRGIGIHHGGLLPILKEVIEILFQEGLVKCLMATETFSMGLNMPAKTVVFTSVRKWDGQQFRWVSGGEYIQMSGRAGRRGLDERGIVILMMDEKMEPAVAKDMLKGHADALNSTFHLGYNMLLNMLRFDGADPVKLIQNSFFQYQNDRHKPVLKKKIADLKETHSKIVISGEQAIGQYHGMKERLTALQEEIHRAITLPLYCLPFLNPGRLVSVKSADEDWGWGVLVNFTKVTTPGVAGNEATTTYKIDVLIRAISSPNGYKPAPTDTDEGQGIEMQVVSHPLAKIYSFSAFRIHVPPDLRSSDSRISVGKSLKEVIKRNPAGIPLLHPVEDMGIKDTSFAKILRNVEDLEERLGRHELAGSPSLPEKLAEFQRKSDMQTEIKILKKELKQTAATVFQAELKHRKRVLRRLGFTDGEDVVQLKGKIACLINSADELVLAELLFGGVFNEMSPAQCAALLTCFIYDEASKEQNLKIRPELEGPYRSLQETARRIAAVSTDCRIQIDPDTYAKKFNPVMMEVAYQWSEGAKFSEIAKVVQGMFEGSIIRVIRRLDELLLELVAACQVIGNAELEEKFSKTEALIKRDIVFAASLYL